VHPFCFVEIDGWALFRGAVITGFPTGSTTSRNDNISFSGATKLLRELNVAMINKEEGNDRIERTVQEPQIGQA